MNEEDLLRAEKAIELLADSLGISEREVVEILREGMESLSQLSGRLSNSKQAFIEEMENTFF